MSRVGIPYEATERVSINARILRKRRGWSAAEFADRLAAVGCGTGRSVIANRETRPRTSGITVDELLAYAKVLGIGPMDLLEELPPICATCSGAPPRGFTCNVCGEIGAPPSTTGDDHE